MCVIAYCKKRKPTNQELDRMESANPDGGGVAWYEGGVTKWQKGISGKQINKIVAEISLPFVVHFRIATVGGRNPSLAHPFMVSPTSPLLQKGETNKTALLFHNGHWTNWEEGILKLSADRMIPNGEWSDTRALAWLMSFKGHSLLKFLPTSNKFVVMYPQGQVKLIGQWENNNGILTSNNYWKFPTYPVSSYPYPHGRSEYEDNWDTVRTEIHKKQEGYVMPVDERMSMQGED